MSVCVLNYKVNFRQNYINLYLDLCRMLRIIYAMVVKLFGLAILPVLR